MLAGARDCINNHIHRRVGRAQVGSGQAQQEAQEEEVMRAEDYYAEPWVAASTDRLCGLVSSSSKGPVSSSSIEV